VISKPILELLYEAAHIQRWNDHIRPQQGFTELDKQSHKMLFAYVIARFEEDEGAAAVDWRRLIEGGIFEFFHRIVLTDIKPPIFHAMMKESGEKLNRWVLEQLRETLQDVGGGFSGKFEQYLLDPGYAVLEKRILKAAHYLATNWEFSIVYRLNQGLYGVEQIKEAIENELEVHSDLAGVRHVSLVRKTRDFLDLVGQLRFQQRWTKSPRIPATSVMGHMLVVAILSFLCSVRVNACDRRVKNNFFAGLFHDLPEVLTRDIVSPVKRSVEGLEGLIKNIENRQIADRILPLLPVSWHGEFKYFIEDEFWNKVMLDGAISRVSSDELASNYNEDRFSPIDGELIKACDHLAAYMEAWLSVSHGITSIHLQGVLRSLPADYRNKSIAGIDFGKVYDSLSDPT